MMLAFAGVGILLGVLGGYVWRYEAIWLLSNFREETTKDKAGLARWAGKWLLAMALLALLTSAGIAFFSPYEGYFVAFFVVTLLLMTIFYLIGGQKYTK